MKKSIGKIAAVLGVSGAMVLGGSAAANAGVLDVWDAPSFVGTIIGSGTTPVVDVPDNRTKSARNGSGFGYSARNVVNPVSSVEVAYIPNTFELRDFGTPTVDHFDRVG